MFWFDYGFMTQSTIFQSSQDGAVPSYLSTIECLICLAQGHYRVYIGNETKNPGPEVMKLFSCSA